MIYDAQLVCSELLTNALRRSRSALPGRHVRVRAEVREHDYVWLAVEDQGGDWTTGSPHGDGRRGAGGRSGDVGLLGDPGR